MPELFLHVSLFFYLVIAPLILFLTNVIVARRRASEHPKRYPVQALLWFIFACGILFIIYEQTRLGCRSMLGECYREGITTDFIIMKTVIMWGHMSMIVASIFTLITRIFMGSFAKL